MEDEEKIEVLEDNLETERTSRAIVESRYRWVIGILLIITSGIGGYAVTASLFTQQVTANTTDIKNLKEQFTRIDSKLDLLLMQKKDAK